MYKEFCTSLTPLSDAELDCISGGDGPSAQDYATCATSLYAAAKQDFKDPILDAQAVSACWNVGIDVAKEVFHQEDPDATECDKCADPVDPPKSEDDMADNENYCDDYAQSLDDAYDQDVQYA